MAVIDNYRATASTWDSAAHNKILHFDVKPDYRSHVETRDELLKQLRVELGDNVRLRVTLETDSFTEYVVLDHDSTRIGLAAVEVVR